MTTTDDTGIQLPHVGARGSTSTRGSKQSPGRGAGRAPLRDQGAPRLLQVALFWIGAVLMPLGIVVILLGYEGVSKAQYDFDREAYFYSGGFIGLGLVFLGGFLYFGAWLARMSVDNRESAQRLNETLAQLTAATQRLADAPAALPATSSASPGSPGPVAAGPTLVTVAGGHTLHRADCALIATRSDLESADDRPDSAELTRCRVCRP